MSSQLSAKAKHEFSSGDMSRGNEVFSEGRIKTTSAGQLGVLAEARGSRGEIYDLALSFRRLASRELGVFCDCHRFFDGHLCKHLWALLRTIDQDYLLQLANHSNLEIFECDPDQVDIGRPLPHRNTRSQAKTQPHWRNQLFSVTASTSQANRRPEYGTKPAKHWFVMALSDFIDHKRIPIHLYHSTQKADGNWGSRSRLRIETSEPSEKLLTAPDERRCCSMLQLQHVNRNEYYRPPRYQLTLSNDLVKETLQALCSTGRFGWSSDASNYLADFHPFAFDDSGVWEFSLTVTQADQQLLVQPTLSRDVEASDKSMSIRQECDVSQVVGVCDSGAVFFENSAGLVAPEACSALRTWRQQEALKVPASELSELIEALNNIPDSLNLDLDESLGVSFETEELKPKLKLTPSEILGDKYVHAEILMCYGDQEVGCQENQSGCWDPEQKTIIPRDFEREHSYLLQLDAVAFRPVQTHLCAAAELELHRRHIVETVTTLTEKGWDVIAEGIRVRRPSTINIEVTSNEDWFDLHGDVKFDEQHASLPALLKALQKGDHFVVLDDGSKGILPEEWLGRLGGISSTGETQGDSIRFRPTQALLLDSLLAEHQNVTKDRNFSKWCKKLEAFSGVKPAKEPRSFKGELRPYQQQGLGWFKFLQEFQLGGCLADDMGLGKTIQVLAMLERRRSRRIPKGQNKKPSIVVVPKSLIFNWLDEAARFTPKLQVLDYTGIERKQSLANQPDFDVLLTTYSTMRIDIESLQKRDFDYAILDEAQAIKNPNSQVAKAARLLKSDHRLGMTGTPVENSLGDLWSLFEFLNPGMLTAKAAKYFNKSKENSDLRLKALGQALRPFLLRRTKQEVLTELPEKTEQTLLCEMTPKQTKLYKELREHYRLRLAKKVKEEGLAKVKIHVLEALLRLRQVACDPRLVDPESQVRGAKLDLLRDSIQELISEGHKVLVFSQFTTLLGLVRNDLKQAKIPFEYLDGKSRKRAESVRRFQENDAASVFLISLKAGGHGLNLTAANYVFILDPWWNPAVEAQAIDRAHRMGQQNAVTAYKLIAKDSVEDKIVKLQKSKRDLADAIVHSEEGIMGSLTAQDLQLLLG
ncbi:MAG: SNF2-related protein [Planctomycetota bacterium]